MERIIGSYEGEERGVLLLAFGGLHGNEPAGVLALQEIFRMLEAEPAKNKFFSLRGKFVGMRGNLKALQRSERFLEQDLNRIWLPEIVWNARKKRYNQLNPEHQELKAILEEIDRQLDLYQPEKIIVLDLHTTTAEGGVFTIPSRAAESETIALGIHAPVVTGMLDGIQGTTLHYFNQENLAVPTVAVTFEAGQHCNPESVRNAISATANCLRATGAVAAENIELKHDNWLAQHSKGLPRLTRMFYRHAVRPKDEFEMLPGFKNFQEIAQKAPVAKDKDGYIHAPEDSFMLMPLYQKQGEDGFFLLKEVENQLKNDAEGDKFKNTLNSL